MTKIDTSREAIEKLLTFLTKGKAVQFHPNFCPEAVGAPVKDWDTSHDISVISEDGSRYRVGSMRHAGDAIFYEAARELVPALLADLEAAEVERDRMREERDEWKALVTDALRIKGGA